MPHDPGGVLVRVALLEAFEHGDDAVLAAMNAAGLNALTGAFQDALDQQVSHFHSGGRTHTVQSRIGSNDIYLRDNRDDQVLWRLDPITIREIIDKLEAMRSNGMCHNYVGITTPAQTLVLSIDEYLVPNTVVRASPFGYF